MLKTFIQNTANSFSLDSLIAIASMVVGFLTLKSTTKIKEAIGKERIREQYDNKRVAIGKLLNQCMRIVIDGNERPANSVHFNNKISQVLTTMDRYFSLDKASGDYSKFTYAKTQLEQLLSIHEAEDPAQDIILMKSSYGNLLGILTELNENGRV